MRFQLQIASADDTSRFSKEPNGTDQKSINNPVWETFIEADDLIYIIENFCKLANDEQISLENNWLRMIIDGEVREY